MSGSRRVIPILAYRMGGGTQRRHVHSGTGAPIKPPEPSDGKRRLIRREGLVARISNDYRPQLPMIRKDIPEPAIPYYVGTARLEEPAYTRMGRVDSRPYPYSEESDDDVTYAEEYESELQQINLRNEAPNQITVDTCGERCAQLDDFNWFLPTDEWNEKSDTLESEIDTSDSGNGVHVNASDSSPSQTEMTTQRLSGPPVVTQTRPKGGCQTAMPRRVRRRRNVRTADNNSAADKRQECVAPSTVDSERIHKMSECITTMAPGLEAAPQASHGTVQPKCSDGSRTDLLPLGSGCLLPAGHDTPAGNPPAEMNTCNTPDNLQIEMSVMSVKMADGSPPADVKILTDSDTLQTEVSVTTVTSERWMERFTMNPQVLCLDGLASDDDREDRSSDVSDEAGVFQDLMPTVVSVRPEVTEKWMDRFVVDLVECPSVSRTSLVARTFGPAVSEEYSPVVFCWGVVADAYPLVVVQSDTAQVSDLQLVESDTAQVSVLQLVGSDTARVYVLPVAGCKFPAVFWGRSPLMWLAWALARRVSEWIRRKLF